MSIAATYLRRFRCTFSCRGHGSCRSSLAASRRGSFAAAGAPGAAPRGRPPTARPMVAGQATQGARLFGVQGSWAGSGKIGYTYQWYPLRPDGSALRAASRRDGREPPPRRERRRSHARPRGSRDRLERVDDGGLEPDRPDRRRAAGARLDRPADHLGRVVQGGTLSVDPGKWSPVPESFSYQWARCNAAGPRVRPDRRRDRRDARGGAGRSRPRARGDRAGPLRHGLAGRLQPGDRRRRRRAAAGAGRAPSSTAPPARRCRRPAGQEADRRRGGLVRLRRDRVRLPVVPLRRRRRALQVDPRRDRAPTRSSRRTSARRSASPCARPTRRERRTPTRASSARSPRPAPRSSRPASRRSPARRARARRCRSRPAAGRPTPTAFGYQWQRCNPNGRLCTPIAGATASTYTVTADDTGHALLAVVHATAGAAHAGRAQRRDAPIAVAPGPARSRAADGDGTLQQGKQLTGIARNLVGLGRDRLRLPVVSLRRGRRALQVDPRRDEGDVHPGRTRRRPDARLRRPSNRCHRHGHGVREPRRPGRRSQREAGLDRATDDRGHAGPGQTLQVSDGSWSRTPTALTYQWQRCNANGRLCTPIAGADAQHVRRRRPPTPATVARVVQAAGERHAAADPQHDHCPGRREAGGGNRTHGRLITRQLLYQLSYSGVRTS